MVDLENNFDDFFTEDKVETFEVVTTNGNLTSIGQNLIREYLSFKKRAEEVEKSFKDALLKAMEENGKTSISGDGFIVSYKAPTTRTTFDSKIFKIEHEDLYNEYLKTSTVASSITIKEKK